MRNSGGGNCWFSALEERSCKGKERSREAKETPCQQAAWRQFKGLQKYIQFPDPEGGHLGYVSTQLPAKEGTGWTEELGRSSAPWVVNSSYLPSTQGSVLGHPSGVCMTKPWPGCGNQFTPEHSKIPAQSPGAPC